MNKTFCDVCGCELPNSHYMAVIKTKEGETIELIVYGTLADGRYQKKDVCVDCIVKTIKSMEAKS